MSDYLEGQIISYWFQNGTVASKPTTVYVTLYTATPGDPSASGTEVVIGTGSYARVAVTNNATNWPGPTSNNGTVSNGAAITFPAPTSNWGTVVAMAIYDAATSGNELFWGALTTSKTINSGDPAPSFPIGSLTVQIDN